MKTQQYRESARTGTLATAETTITAGYPSTAGRGTPAGAGTPIAHEFHVIYEISDKMDKMSKNHLLFV
jgi:hypothetical protein